VNPRPVPDQAGIEAAIADVGGEDTAAALSALTALAKKEAARAAIGRALPRDRLYAALAADDPKARKNAARLLGALGRESDAPALIAALQKEETHFVRPSMILALGAVGGEAAKACLDALPAPLAARPDEEKHAREEAEALRRARARLTQTETHVFRGFSAPHEVVLQAPAGFAPLLAQELQTLAIPSRPAGENALSVRVTDTARVFRARCFSEMLFPLADGFPPVPSAAARAVRAPLEALLRDALAGPPPYAYRVECPELEDRAGFIAALASLLDGEALMNSPSHYEAELRLTFAPGGTLDAACRISALPDDRFSYRRRVLPASMHPATAACVARYAAGFIPAPRRVLDPFCGSGTLLIEWSKLCPRSALTGVDIAQTALDAARENLAAANVRAGLVRTDSAAFAAREPYDLVLSNLPFGNRVGTHKDNERLYRTLCGNLPVWLAPGGVAVLYTMEYALLHRCLAAQKSLRRLGETRTSAGGLLPWAIAVGKNE